MYISKATNLRIVRLVMQETGTYNDQFSRPYVTNFDAHTLNAVTERVIERGHGRFDPASLSGLASSFISPSSAPEGQIAISNGWGEKRIRFLMEVECQFQIGGSVTSYIQGYTNFPGVTNNQAVAPDMEFFVNSIITTKKNQVMTPYGAQVFESVTDNSHLLCSNNWSGMQQPGQQRLIRPQDVFCNMEVTHIPGIYDADTSAVYDGRTVLKREATKSARVNGLAGAFATKIIDGYVVGNATADFGQSDLSILNRSRSEVAESQASLDPFLSALNGVTNNGIVNRFKFSDLVKLDQNIHAVTNYAVTGLTQLATQHNAGQTTAWHGSDRTTVAATVLSQSVPAIMMDLMINRIIFKTTNHTVTGQMETVLIDAKSFSNMDLTRHLDLFIRRLEKEVLQDLTFNNQIAFAIEMRIDLLGETWINISIDGNPAFDYVTPSFCDNLFVPVITTNLQTVQNLTHDFSNLVSNVREAIGSTQDSITIAVSV